jgi:hypothetical protein
MSVPAHGGTGIASDAPERPAVRRRSWLEVRWRQLRSAPRPIVRAVAANVIVATLGGVALLSYDVAIGHGATLPGGDLRGGAIVAYVLLVVAVGSIATYLWVPLPSGGGTRRRRTPWAGMLGFFASLPVAYIGLVLIYQVMRPWFG